MGEFIPQSKRILTRPIVVHMVIWISLYHSWFTDTIRDTPERVLIVVNVKQLFIVYSILYIVDQFGLGLYVFLKCFCFNLRSRILNDIAI